MKMQTGKFQTKFLAVVLSSMVLVACGGGGSSSPTAPASNVAPVAHAGASQSVVTNSVVTLDASASSDANGDLLTYAWTLTSKPVGSSAALSSSNAVKPTLTADIAGTYVFSVIVNDGKVDSPSVSVSVTASVANASPVANAGTAQSILVGALVTLDGSTSADANGDLLTFAWTLTSRPTGSVATLSSLTSPKPTFTADLAGTYVASLTVNDGKGVSGNVATVSVTASAVNAAPVANAGVAQNVLTGTVVTLDGSASSDANSDPLTYAWTLTSKPAGSSAALSLSTSAKPTFTADVAGTYVVSLTVNDGKVSSTAVTASVTAAVANVAPLANAGVGQNVTTGTQVTLNGSTSSDANGDALTYLWSMTSKPAGSTATITGTTSAMPTFTADAAGIYVASLTVNDGKLNSTASTVTITAAVLNVAPVANAGVAQNVVTGTLVTLDGSTSSDANGDSLTYAWTLTAKPTGSTATLSSATSVKPTFTADLVGTYVASLIVNDGKVNSGASTVSVAAAVLNVAPVANAGAAQKVVATTLVTLDGSASSDANGDPLTFAWTLTATPTGSTATLSSSSTDKPTFTADVAGTYVVTLVVNDGKVSSSAKTVAITAVTDLSQLFSRSASSAGMQVGTFWQAGSTFSLTIGNGSSETFDLTKYEFLNGGTLVTSTSDLTLLSGGQLTPAESVGITITLARATSVSSTPGNGFQSIYYLTLTRTGQQFTVVYNW
jgi:hypothetical protein